MNQCLKHLLLLLDTKRFIFAPRHLIWSGSKTVLLCFCCAALGGSANAVGPRRSSPYADEPLALAGRAKVWPSGDRRALNQANDQSIMRTVYTGVNKLLGLVLNRSQALLLLVLYCSSVVVCFQWEVNVKASLHTNENISMHSCPSAYEYMHK